MFILQLVDDSKLNSLSFNSQTIFIGWQYALFVENIPEYKSAKFKNITIAVNDFIKDDYLINGNKGMYSIPFRYNLLDYFKLSDEAKKEEINNLYYKYLKLLFEKIKLPIEPLTEIYHQLIKNDYDILLSCIKHTFSKDKQHKASVVVKPDLKSFIYYLQIQDVESKDVLHKVLLFNGRQGSSWLLKNILFKLKWQSKDTVQILNKHNQVIYSYSIASNELETVDISGLEMYLV